MATRIIDAHHHLWRYSQPEFPWISETMAVLRRDHLIAEFEAVARQNGVEHAITVQALQTIEETEWLLQIAEQSHLIRGVVGWLPLTDPKIQDFLDQFAPHPKFMGLRHIVQDEPDPQYLLRPDFNAGIRALRDFKLTYDLLVLPGQLEATIRFVDVHPNQTFVLDHMAKPPIACGELQPWERYLHQLAERENVSCKLSGLVTEARWQSWDLPALRPYFEVALDCFGPKRLMFGSDWPVMGLASPYTRWLDTVQSLISHLAESEIEQILHGTAERIYCRRGLPDKP